jgi:hypothetical protein
MTNSAKKQEDPVQKAIRERDEFLARHPHLRPMQNEIDRRLKEVGDDAEKRMQVIAEMIVDVLNEELAPTMEELYKACDDFAEKTKAAGHSDGSNKKTNLVSIDKKKGAGNA